MSKYKGEDKLDTFTGCWRRKYIFGNLSFLYLTCSYKKNILKKGKKYRVFRMMG